jgi:tRNA(fMet)-specific endonuclease VapC
MNGSVLADTNIVIAIFAGEPEIIQKLQQQRSVFLCVPVLGELRYGALASTRVQQNIGKLDELARATTVLECNVETAKSYAEVKLSLRKKGKPVPENDVWIAALARQHNLTLVTRDAHFRHVDGFDCEIW